MDQPTEQGPSQQVPCCPEDANITVDLPSAYCVPLGKLHSLSELLLRSGIIGCQIQFCGALVLQGDLSDRGREGIGCQTVSLLQPEWLCFDLSLSLLPPVSLSFFIFVFF